MSKIDDAINALTPEEMDLLDQDPQLMSEFKAKYAEPTSQPSLLSRAAEGVKEGLKQTALQAATSPLPLPVLGAMNLGMPLVGAADEFSRRGNRGIGVGLETGSLDRAAAAVQPDYVPREGEKIGAFLGSHAQEIIPVGAGAVKTGARVGAAGLRALFAPSEATNAAEFASALGKAGIPKRAPSISEVSEILDLPRGKRSTADVANAFKDLKGLMSPSETHLVKSYLSDQMKIRPTMLETTTGSVTAEENKLAAQKLANEVPGYGDAMKHFEARKLREDLFKGGKRLAAGGGIVGATYLSLRKLLHK